MARPLTKDEVEARIGQKTKDGSKATLLLYKTARTDMKLLDEMFGSLNWQCSYENIDGKMYCTISVWDNEKKCWVSKSNVGSESNVDAEKGEASDAMKRAGFLWGIGRELYDTPTIWVDLDEDKYPQFEVAYISHDENGKIIALGIDRVKGGNRTTVFTYGPKPMSAPATRNEPSIRPQDVFNKLMGKLGYDKTKGSDSPRNKACRELGKRILAEQFDIKELGKADLNHLENAMVGIDTIDFNGPEYFIDDGGV